MIITLIGYMGAGKSTIGRHLAEILEYTFIDLDDYIVAKEGQTVKEIFQHKGEIYFRKVETKYLNEIITEQDNIVLAVGGGTPCYGNNMEVMNQENVVSIYLKLSPGYLANRLFNERAGRPLISHLDTIEALTEFVGIHLFERQSYYHKAKLMIAAEDKTVADLSRSIVKQLY